MFGGAIGAPELILVLILVLVLFGPKRIPEIMRGLGQGIRQFKEASSKAISEIEEATVMEPHAPAPKPVATAPAASAPAPEEPPAVHPQ